ncbi:MAG: tRNA threonylcarbamoyladenosine dehydratase [Proteobacteria bacterium]|nr:tRNA threonylcarbamoyladenosine dehydratase [Pseudomonadota bacterium]
MNNNDWLIRTRLLVGNDGVNRLAELHILLAGVGGVGGFVAEALARAGVGKLTLIDMDKVADSNRNRQIVALVNTLGRDKVEVMRERIALINPDCDVVVVNRMVCHDAEVLLSECRPDVVIDAIDSLNCKVALLIAAVRAGIPVYSSMGAGRRLDVRKVCIQDVMDTTGCALAREVRSRLRKAGIGRGITCVASTELPRAAGPLEAAGEGRARAVNGTLSYMPGIFGLMLAGEVLRQVLVQD